MAEGNVDRIVQQAFFPGSGEGRVIVDVGAARPDYLSISALFRSLGWRVVAIEPNPVFCEMHRRLGYEVLQYACGDHDEDNVDFTIVESLASLYEGEKVTWESFSSLGIKDSYLDLYRNASTRATQIKVNLRRLDSILEKHAADIKRIDILSADVEGWELQVMSGFSVNEYRPGIMIIENLFNSEKYRSFMQKIGYSLWNVFSPNDVYVSEELSTIARSQKNASKP